MKPLDFLGIPKNIDLDNLDDSIVKTPKKEPKEPIQQMGDKKVAPFLEFDHDEDDSISEQKSRRSSNINIKNFDDFKNVLKDVKMSLNISYYSEFHEDWQENFQKLEDVLFQYNKLDHQMKDFYLENKDKEKQTSFLGKIIFEREDTAQKKHHQSFNIGNEKQFKSSKLDKLDKLLRKSKLHYYESEISKLKSNPMNFESVFMKIKEEFQNRQDEFAQIQELFSSY